MEINANSLAPSAWQSNKIFNKDFIDVPEGIDNKKEKVDTQTTDTVLISDKAMALMAADDNGSGNEPPAITDANGSGNEPPAANSSNGSGNEPP